MPFETIIGIVLVLLVVVWFLYELTALIRAIVKRVREKKSFKEVKGDVRSDDYDCNDSHGDTFGNN